jgi:Uma2 family endonuclease
MIEVKGVPTFDLPYTIRLYGVTEEMFDELVNEDLNAELMDGVLIMNSPASYEHDEITGFVRALMSFYIDVKGAGRVLGPDSIVHLATCRKFAPDVFYISPTRVPTPRPREFEGAPDLVVEVLSPSNRSDDLEGKRFAYQEAGVPEIWFVDRDSRQMILDRKQGESYVTDVVTEGRVHSAVLEGFWIDLSWLWADLLPNRMACLQEILAGSETK